MKHRVESIYPVQMYYDETVNAHSMTKVIGNAVRQGNHAQAIHKVCACYAKIFNLKIEVAVALLTGEIDYEVDGDAICFNWPDDIRKEWE